MRRHCSDGHRLGPLTYDGSCAALNSPVFAEGELASIGSDTGSQGSVVLSRQGRFAGCLDLGEELAKGLARLLYFVPK
jgi:hypothetical protein